MTLVSWRPARDIFRFRDEMDRLFDDYSDRIPVRKESNRQIWNPEVDIHETDQEIVLKAEIPGMDQDDINITVKEDVLTLKGEKKKETEEKEARFHRVERTYGAFTRVFTLPAHVVAEKTTAEYKNGVLVITLPKVEEAKPREIKVDVN